MKLFRVDLALTVYVAAESETDVERKIKYDQDVIVDNELDHLEVGAVVEILDLKHLPKEWQTSIPYGDNPKELTCQQIVAAAT